MAVATVDLQTITGVEIFRVGKWNGKRFTAADLDAMVAAFTEVGFRPPLKLGHSFDPSAPAAGYVVNLRRSGDVLLADFVDVQPEVYEAIKARKYDTVSCEIWFDVDRNQKNFPLLLTAVALLGGDIPAVDLKPLHEVVLEATHKEALVFSFPRIKEVSPMSEQKNTPDAAAQAAEIADLKAKLAAAEAKATEAQTFSAGEVAALRARLAESEKRQAEFAAKARKAELEQKTRSVVLPSLRPYFSALYDLVLDIPTKVLFSADSKAEAAKEKTAVEILDDLAAALNAPTRAKLFTESSTEGDREVVLRPGASKAEVQAQVDALVKAYQAAHDKVTYTVALDKVLSDPAHAELKLAYARVQ